MTGPYALVVLGAALLLAAAGTWGRRSRGWQPGDWRALGGWPWTGRASDGAVSGRASSNRTAAAPGTDVHTGAGARGGAARDRASAPARAEGTEPVADTGIVLELLAIATAATSLPEALRVVGDAVGGPTGRGLTTAGAALVLGAGWDEAWATVSASGGFDASEPPSATGTRATLIRPRRPRGFRAGRGHAPTQSVLGLVAGCLRPAWEQGAAPASALRAARDRHDRETEARAVEAAERLAVRVVVPLGLCLLPAFVLLGLVPAVIALGTGLL